LAGKEAMSAKKKAFYFAFLHVLVFFCVCMLLSVSIFRKIFASKINHAEKPTIGFCFLAGSANIVS